MGGVTYTLSAIDGTLFDGRRSIPALPSQIVPYAHAVQTFSISEPLFHWNVTVPASTAFTLVIN